MKITYIDSIAENTFELKDESGANYTVCCENGRFSLQEYHGEAGIQYEEVTTLLEISPGLIGIRDCTCKWLNEERFCISGIELPGQEVQEDYTFREIEELTLTFKRNCDGSLLLIENGNEVNCPRCEIWDRLTVLNLFSIAEEFARKYPSHDMEEHLYSEWRDPEPDLPRFDESCNEYLNRKMGKDVMKMIAYYTQICQAQQMNRERITQIFKDVFVLTPAVLKLKNKTLGCFLVTDISSDNPKRISLSDDMKWYIASSATDIDLYIIFDNKEMPIAIKESFMANWNNKRKQQADIVCVDVNSMTLHRRCKLDGNGQPESDWDNFFCNFPATLIRELNGFCANQ